jgi:hypothetical protein
VQEAGAGVRTRMHQGELLQHGELRSKLLMNKAFIPYSCSCRLPLLLRLLLPPAPASRSNDLPN